jgi:hypothetical protein
VIRLKQILYGGNMKRKIISIILQLVFICFTVSCYSIKQINLAKGEAWDHCGKVTTVFTRSGDLIEFSKRKPGIMKQHKIVGTVFYETGIPKKVSIPIEEAEVVWVKKMSGKTFLLPFAVLGSLLVLAPLLWD